MGILHTLNFPAHLLEHGLSGLLVWAFKKDGRVVLMPRAPHPTILNIVDILKSGG